MKTKLLEKLDTVLQMGLFYLSILCTLFIIAMIMGKSIGRTALSYGLMSRCMVNLGLFTLCLLIFMTDIIFVKLKYNTRIILSVIAGFIIIEAYTLYQGLILTGNPTAYLLTNQMLFLEFIFLLVGWFIYSKLTARQYQKLLTTYQSKHN